MVKKSPVFFNLLLIIFISSCEMGSSDSRELEFGITLDCARRYHSVAEIKQYIDVLSGHNGAFLQLHLTDNENMGLESSYLGQTEESAQINGDGSYKNPDTGYLFLTKNQINDILDYADEKDVKIIPEIDMPAHAGAILELAKLKYGEDYADSITADGYEDDGELDISGEAGPDFAVNVYAEYAQLFQGCKYFHIGCDEFFSGSDEEIISYMEKISSFLMGKGFVVRIWNDLLKKNSIASIPKGLEINYWSYDGDVEDPAESASRRAERASVPDLQDGGFDVLIYNSYYLYYVPSTSNYNNEDLEYMEDDLGNNWNIKQWDGESGVPLSNTEHIIGAAISIWNEDSAGLTTSDILSEAETLYEIILEKR